jgi:FkbM family methyltransferase
MDYCAFDVRNNDSTYNMLGRPLGGDHRILRELLVDQQYEPILKLLPSRPISVVDIGAHIGAFIVWLSRKRAIKEAFCFEPDPDSFNLCQFNLRNLGSACVYRQAIGGRSRTGEMWIEPSAHAKSSVVLQRKGAFKVPVEIVSLADCLEKVKGDLDLLKIDCEGAEWEDLDMCPEAFRRFNVIAGEIHRDPRGKRDAKDFAGELERQGLETLQLDKPEGFSDTFYVGKRKQTKE